MSNIIDLSYNTLLGEIFTNGFDETDRTSVGLSRQLFGRDLRFDTKGKYAPFIQTRNFAPRISFLEFQWMMSGSTDTTFLRDRGIHIWDGNTTREFLDQRGLFNTPTGDIGKAYGYQFRNFGGVDQIQKTLDAIREKPSRRHVITIYNPPELDDGALEPCAYAYTFSVIGGRLHIHQQMRSADVLFGVPYNLGFSFWFFFTFSKLTGYPMGEIWVTMTNAHIYRNQFDAVEHIMNFDEPTNGVTTEPWVELKEGVELNELDDLFELEYSDFIIHDFTRGENFTKDIEMAV